MPRVSQRVTLLCGAGGCIHVHALFRALSGGGGVGGEGKSFPPSQGELQALLAAIRANSCQVIARSLVSQYGRIPANSYTTPNHYPELHPKRCRLTLSNPPHRPTNPAVFHRVRRDLFQCRGGGLHASVCAPHVDGCGMSSLSLVFFFLALVPLSLSRFLSSSLSPRPPPSRRSLSLSPAHRV